MVKKLKNTIVLNEKGLSYFDEDGYELTHQDDIKEFESRLRKKKKDQWLKKNEETKYKLSRWGQEVVKILKDKGEMKNVDIMEELRNRGCNTSATHIRAFFKSESGKKFYKEQLVGNGGYWSLKD